MMNIHTQQKGTFLLSTILFSFVSFANSPESNAHIMFTAIYNLVSIFATALGLVLMIVGLTKLKRRADNPNDPRSFPTSIIITVLSGALLFNYNQTSGTMISSIFGSQSGHCFVLDKTAGSGDYVGEHCWDSSTSELLDGMRENIDKHYGDKDMKAKMEENVETLIAVFQIVGLIYLMKGLYGLKTASEGTGKDSYGKSLVTIVASALVIDLPHTIEMFQATIEYLGFGIQ